MGKATGFIEISREQPKERDPKTRVSDWGGYQERLDDEALKRQGARCMSCSIPFCHMGLEFNNTTSGCPIHNLIPEWNDLVYKGKWKEALERLMLTNNFPEFTGRVCPAPCEGACTVSMNDDAVAIKNIERAIIDKGFEMGYIQPRIPKERTGKKIAIIGSGPSGLASADQLNQAGHSVDVYEKSNRAGGLLTYGIPNMKLEKDVVARRIKLLEDEGITFVLNTEIGKDIQPETLKRDYDSVIVATGAQHARDLPIKGRDLNGIHLAMDYLTDQTKALLDDKPTTLTAKEKDVIVIGGGDTAADCVATALRQGAKSVRQFAINPVPPKFRQPMNEWPSYPFIFKNEYAHHEAKAIFNQDIREYLIETHAFIDDGEGNVQALFTRQLEEKVTDQGNQYERVENGDDVWPAQLIIVAIGFVGAEMPLLDRFGIKTENGRISAKYGQFRTNIEGVFASGDARRGPSLIVWAINEGREVAKEVDEYLMGKSYLPSVREKQAI
ncbi:glutamate synthase (NADPH) small subunit [Streptohalobacillus salinus]|uniref:Glutamate synthase (NADPH) small subunit n=1 Tax=Streptohalobacillus salinus TaxID=621096 RepID=A0A2V3WFB8_9BACI|nr:glutamate synthase subunit beta [Streptohalobacillus salinus]PXW91841.1 glutamate synthase (NADPH) small subunit [Streptohalobacillus salinus]